MHLPIYLPTHAQYYKKRICYQAVKNPKEP